MCSNKKDKLQFPTNTTFSTSRSPCFFPIHSMFIDSMPTLTPQTTTPMYMQSHGSPIGRVWVKTHVWRCSGHPVWSPTGRCSVTLSGCSGIQAMRVEGGFKQESSRRSDGDELTRWWTGISWNFLKPSPWESKTIKRIVFR